ncbi:hypothetical protein CL618_01280, partial [archaeon]|nr:hypothetical protein [archaeon]
MLKKEGKIVIGVLIIVALVVISIVNPDLTGFAVKKLDNVCKTVEVSNGEAKCGSGYTIMGGGWAGSIGSYGIPQADGFSCEDDSSSSKCYAICCDASEVDSIVVSETGRLDYGIKTYCPSGYEVVSGGFEDKIVNTDQDSLSPLNNNGWYCQDDDSSDKGSTCYAVCAKSKDTSLKLSCKTEIKKA